MVKFVVAFCLLALPLCAAQEVEGTGKGAGALFSNTSYLELTTPLTSRVGVNTYGFYLGNLRTSLALLEVPISIQKHFTITPAYLFINVPPSGLMQLIGKPVSSTYHESQFQLAGTFLASFHGFNISDRNMYVSRFTPTGEVNRYRNRIYASRQVSFGTYKATLFVFEEVYHDFLPQRWLRRNWVAAGIALPINQYLTFQPSYIRHDDLFLRSVNFLNLGVIIKTGKLIDRAKAQLKDARGNGDEEAAFALPEKN